jgi:N-acetylmuramoyl-L-alanine amidase
LCDVVKQNQPGRFSACQFSWNCDGRADHPDDHQAWRESVLLASAMLARDSAVVDPTNGAKWYHSVHVKPGWSDKLKVSRVISGHVFYRDPKAPTRERRLPTNFADWAAERVAKRYQQIAQY